MNLVLSFESLKLIGSVFCREWRMPQFSGRKQYQKGETSFILICYQEYSLIDVSVTKYLHSLL